MVNFVIRHDKKKIFRFAALQSEAGQKLLEEYGLAGKNFDSFVLIKDGVAYQKSTAGLVAWSHLPWYMQYMKIFWLVPKFLRDRVYDFIAANRYKWFGKKESCMIPSDDVRSRFLS
jgi:predicted DCC family thiol-disulfide oxidoreductase YuxK